MNAIQELHIGDTVRLLERNGTRNLIGKTAEIIEIGITFSRTVLRVKLDPFSNHLYAVYADCVELVHTDTGLEVPVTMW